MIWHCGSFRFDLGPPSNVPWVMGIVNVTPDSFSDGGQFVSDNHAVTHALSLVREGAHIIDVGGESTRPNHAPVPLQDELARVVPIVKQLSAQGICISIDTHKAAVMKAALNAGAAIVNDVNALHDEGAIDLMRNSDCGIVIMDGFSSQDQASKRAGQGLLQRLAVRYAALMDIGIAPNRVVIDPGIGFDKTLEENLDCIRLLPQLRLIAPVLIGISRKSVLGVITGQLVEQRLSASVAAALLAAQRGAAVIRVHDVQSTADGFKVWRALGQ